MAESKYLLTRNATEATGHNFRILTWKSFVHRYEHKINPTVK